ncbi:MAG: CpsD/CapB family tyrosine-protein kinase [Clostridiales bacterium]|nr:CpsD/CapB family tyrosine-protein kinase [Clostridiales bacterium]
MAKLLIDRDPKSPISEAYRTLRTNIQFSSVDKPIQTLVVTSSGATEGKSTTASNIAASFTQMGKSVVLVDADLRRPRLAKMFDLSNREGLSSVLYQKEDVFKQIRKVEGMHVLPSGPIPPNPAEMLSSDRMKNVVDSLKAAYDYVIIDSPPVSYVTDGAILSSICDGTLLVVAAGQTDQRMAIAAKEQLDKVSANILGVVLTKIPTKGRGYYKYHYSNLYSYKEYKK